MPQAQLILLPARTSAEASAWGSVTLEYMARFRDAQANDIHLTRDARDVDWRGYQHITIVRPDFWAPDLILTIKQANPKALIDLIPVDTPEALLSVLASRIYYGWRYGPHSDVEWARWWTPNRCLIGVHGRADGEFQEADFPLVEQARAEAVKLTSHATAATVDRLLRINPDVFILVRPIEAFWLNNAPRNITPEQFFANTAPDLDRLFTAYPALKYIEIHNEPNLYFEGFGGSWRDGAEFGAWFLRVMELYRARFPQALYGFPGLSPGYTNLARVDEGPFLAAAAPAAQQADWIGIHSYWINETEMNDPRLGQAHTQYRKLFPEKLLFITEFGNPADPKPVVAEQYAKYYGTLRNVPGLGAAFAYVLSTSDKIESPRWGWRDEAGNDMGIARVVGMRKYVVDKPTLP